AMVKEHMPFVLLPVVKSIAADEDIAVPIPVHIPGAGYGGTEPAVYLVAFENRDRKGSIEYTIFRPVIDKHSAFIELAIVIMLSTHRNVRIAVAIYMSCAGDRGTRAGVDVAAREDSGW